jgi:hypothetical protein
MEINDVFEKHNDVEKVRIWGLLGFSVINITGINRCYNQF